MAHSKQHMMQKHAKTQTSIETRVGWDGRGGGGGLSGVIDPYTVPLPPLSVHFLYQQIGSGMEKPAQSSYLNSM